MLDPRAAPLPGLAQSGPRLAGRNSTYFLFGRSADDSRTSIFILPSTDSIGRKAAAARLESDILILSPVADRKLHSGWQHLFRLAILKRMPAGKLADYFYPVIGHPTKELYSMAGLLFIREFRD